MKLSICLLIGFFIAPLINQNANDPYCLVLKEYSAMRELYSKEIDNYVYIQEAAYLSEAHCGRKQEDLVFVSDNKLKDLTAGKRVIRMAEIKPIQFVDGKIVVAVVEFTVSRRGRMYKFGRGDTYFYKLYLDCEIGEYRIEPTNE